MTITGGECSSPGWTSREGKNNVDRDLNTHSQEKWSDAATVAAAAAAIATLGDTEHFIQCRAFHCTLHATFLRAQTHTRAHTVITDINLFFIVFITATIFIVAFCHYCRTTAIHVVLFVCVPFLLARSVSFSTIKMNEALLNRAENDDEKQRWIQAEIIFNLASHLLSVRK